MPDTDLESDRPLIDLSVREFVDAVASAEHPVPAGGSVAALSGAASAALLALVCRVLERRRRGVFGEELQQLERLQTQLLALVDEDAAGFHAFLHAKRSGTEQEVATERVMRTPLAIGWACTDIVELSHAVEKHEVGSMRGDVRAARHLAQAAVRTALDIAEANIELRQDPAARAALVDEITRLRARL